MVCCSKKMAGAGAGKPHRRSATMEKAAPSPPLQVTNGTGVAISADRWASTPSGLSPEGKKASCKLGFNSEGGAAHRAMQHAKILSRVFQKITFDLKLSYEGLMNEAIKASDLSKPKETDATGWVEAQNLIPG